MRTILRGATALALSSLAFLPVTASAQSSTNPVRFGATAGATLPVGDFGDVADVGFHLGALADFRFAGSPVGMRIDGQWHRNAISDFDANSDIIFGAASLTFEPTAPGSSVVPYALGGIGVYHVKLGGDALAGVASSELTETKAGFNVGGGFKFKLSGFDTFVEARFHTVGTSDSRTNFVPISFGIIF